MLKVPPAPVNALEKAVLCKDNAAIVDLIADGACLTRPDILATKEAFDLYYPAALLLLESAPCLREDSAVKRLEELGAHPEMVDLVRETAMALPENSHPQSRELLKALAAGDEPGVANLVVNDCVSLSSADLEIFNSLEDFSNFTAVNFLDEGITGRLQSQFFLALREKCRNASSDRVQLLFETLKEIIKDGHSAARESNINALWKKYTTPPYIEDIEKSAELFSDEYLADFIIDQELSFSARPFSSFAPYYQAVMLNSAGVAPDLFDEEAEIEKFDAQAVFELLRYSAEYAPRVNWELVNKTAKASEFLAFLAENPCYADKADWQMINVHACETDWFAFLQQQPALLEKCENPRPLYQLDPELWQEIYEKSGLPENSALACLWRLDEESEWEYCFKVRNNAGKAEFYDVCDLYSFKKFSSLINMEFAALETARRNPDANQEIFVNIIR